MVHDFLVEIGCEELPPKALLKLAESLKDEIFSGLVNAKIDIAQTQLTCFATPRRLAVIVTGLQPRQPDILIEKKGPSYSAAFDAQGKATPAAQGFAKSCNTTVDALQIIETPQGKWLGYRTLQTGQETIKLLPAIVESALGKLPIPKLMRWGSYSTEFARPVHWVVMLYGNQIIPAEILGLTASNITYGHRFHHPAAIEISHVDNYEQQLEDAYVIADFNKRRDIINKQLQQIATQLNATIVSDDALLELVTAIVEFPVALLASFDAEFLKVPQEALIAAMQDHQKSFALKNQQGELLANFLTVANINSSDPQQVILGNERVMRARLADAAFFYHKDQQHSLESKIDATKNVIYQAKLGSLYDKSQRLSKIVEWLAPRLQLSLEESQRAAKLSKCDLLTDMVNEFPELQGTMGYYYALHDGETQDVALALKQQYYPRFAGDILPSSALGTALALAERVDTLVGIFGINQKPSGTKDPFKLRRQALGIIRILMEQPYDIDLQQLLEQTALANYWPLENSNVVTEVHEFMLERLKAWYQEKGIGTDVIAAVLVRQTTLLWDFDQRVHAVNAFIKNPAAQSLAIANKRVNNILLSEGLEKNANNSINAVLLESEAEQGLATALQLKQQQVQPLCATAQYTKALEELAELREPVDRFFDEVLVLVDDEKIRHNRLVMLANLRQLFLQVADVSLLQAG